MIIYKATNKFNNKCYIGQTIGSLRKRKIAHRSSMNNGVYFHNALKKYGWDNFIWKIIENCDSKEELDEMEFHYIKQYDTFKNGYNMTLGGAGNPDMSGEKNGMYGKTHSKETIKKICQTKAKREASKGEKNGMYGKTHSKEARKKISESHKGNKSWCKGLTKETDERVKKIAEKRQITMKENGLYKTGRESNRFKNIDEELLIVYFNQGLSYTKIGEKMGICRKFISRRINLLKKEGIINDGLKEPLNDLIKKADKEI